MKAHKYPTSATTPWRVIVPEKLSDTGKRYPKYFKTEEDAHTWIARETGQPAAPVIGTEAAPLQGPLPTSSGSHKQTALLERLLAQSEARFADLQARMDANKKKLKFTGTWTQMLEDYFTWSKSMGNQDTTLAALHAFINRFLQPHEYPGDPEGTWRSFGLELKNDIRTIIYCAPPDKVTFNELEAFIHLRPAGSSTRFNDHTFLNAIRVWADTRGWMIHNPMAGMAKKKRKSLNTCMKDLVPLERALRICSGLDPLPPLPENFKLGKKSVIIDFTFLVPYFALGAFDGARRIEMIKPVKHQKNRNLLEWEDINWRLNRIDIRDGVAKKTRRKSSKGDQRYVVMTEPLIAWLKPFAKTTGKIYPCGSDKVSEYMRQLCARLGIKRFDQNTLRHSFASYSVDEFGTAKTARNMGDAESTIIDKYVEVVEPGQGKIYFGILPTSKVIQMPQADAPQMATAAA